jgi:hypothetical protein
MTVYVDDAIWVWQGLKWCHLLADDIDELHRFAARLGIHRSSYQGPPKTRAAHYDLTSFERARAIALGAVSCGREDIVAVLRLLRTTSGGGAAPRFGLPLDGRALARAV